MLSDLRAAAARSLALFALGLALPLGAGCELPEPVCAAAAPAVELPPELCPPPEEPDDEVAPGWIQYRPFPEIDTLYDVDVLAEDSVYAVGTGGAVLHFDGEAWARQDSGVDTALRAVSGITDESNGDFVVAVGDAGVVLKKDGDGDWTAVTNNYDDLLFDVWVRNRLDAFIVGGNGRFLRFLGEEVVAMLAESEQTRWVQGNICYDDPDRRAELGLEPCPEGTECRPGDPDDPDSQTICWNPDREDGLILETYYITDPLKGVAGTNENNVFAIGPRGLVMRFDGMQWRRDDAGTARTLSSVYTGAGVWATAQDGVLLRRRGDNDWDSQSYRLPVPLFLQDVWASGGNDVFVVGLAGTVFHFTEGEWQETPFDEEMHLRAIDGVVTEPATEMTPLVRDVYAVGAGGRIVRGPEAVAETE